MKNLFFLLNLCLGNLIFAQTFDPILPKEGRSLDELTPIDFILCSSTEGDLNGDGIKDLVLVVQDTDSRNIEHLGYMDQSINRNPRILGIYFGSKSGHYSQQIISKNFILIKDSPSMSEPLTGMKIDKGILSIGFELWYSMGSWETSAKIYKFKYINNAFQLIGFDLSEFNRASGDEIDYSINFLTNKMKIIKGNMAYDEKSSEEWKGIILHDPITLESLDHQNLNSFEGIYL